MQFLRLFRASFRAVVAWYPSLTSEQQLLLSQLKRNGIELSSSAGDPVIQENLVWMTGLRDQPRAWSLLLGLGNLKHITLDGSLYTDWDLQQLAKITSLESIYLYDTDISTGGLERLGDLPHLKRLGISGSDIDGQELVLLMHKLPQLQIEHGLRSGKQHPPPPVRLAGSKRIYLDDDPFDLTALAYVHARIPTIAPLHTATDTR